jgi:exodeoxyribonuclease VII large subunit
VARLRQRLQVAAAHPLLQRPETLLQARAQRLDDAGAGLADGIRALLGKLRVRLDKAALRLDALSPLAVLGRGYAIVRRRDDRVVVRVVSDAEPGTGLTITVNDGEIGAVAEGA